MILDIKSMFKEDIWEIIHGNSTFKERNFFKMIIHYMLDCKSIDLLKVEAVSNRLDVIYDELIDWFTIELGSPLLDIIKLMNKANKEFDSKVGSIIKEIDSIKRNGHSKNNSKKAIRVA